MIRRLKKLLRGLFKRKVDGGAISICIMGPEYGGLDVVNLDREIEKIRAMIRKRDEAIAQEFWDKLGGYSGPSLYQPVTIEDLDAVTPFDDFDDDATRILPIPPLTVRMKFVGGPRDGDYHEANTPVMLFLEGFDDFGKVYRYVKDFNHEGTLYWRFDK